jgi:hypothetical protein
MLFKLDLPLSIFRYVVVPFGTYMGVNDKSKKDEILQNPVLEMEYQKSKRPSSKVIEVGLA